MRKCAGRSVAEPKSLDLRCGTLRALCCIGTRRNCHRSPNHRRIRDWRRSSVFAPDVGDSNRALVSEDGTPILGPAPTMGKIHAHYEDKLRTSPIELSRSPGPRPGLRHRMVTVAVLSLSPERTSSRRLASWRNDADRPLDRTAPPTKVSVSWARTSPKPWPPTSWLGVPIWTAGHRDDLGEEHSVPHSPGMQGLQNSQHPAHQSGLCPPKSGGGRIFCSAMGRHTPSSIVAVLEADRSLMSRVWAAFVDFASIAVATRSDVVAREASFLPIAAGAVARAQISPASEAGSGNGRRPRPPRRRAAAR